PDSIAIARRSRPCPANARNSWPPVCRTAAGLASRYAAPRRGPPGPVSRPRAGRRRGAGAGRPRGPPPARAGRVADSRRIPAALPAPPPPAGPAPPAAAAAPAPHAGGRPACDAAGGAAHDFTVALALAPEPDAATHAHRGWVYLDRLALARP